MGETHLVNVLRNKTGSEIVFTDEYNKNDLFYYLDWDLDGFINLYKSYDYCALGKETEPEQEVSDLFQDGERCSGLYGTIVFNNDGIEDWTRVYMFFSSRLPYHCNYWLFDGRTDEKNLFLCVLGGDGNYILKLIEIRGMEPVEIQNWFMTVESRILICKTGNA